MVVSRKTNRSRGGRLARALSIAALVVTSFAAASASPNVVVGIPASIVVPDAGVSETVFDGVDYGNPATPHDDRPTQTTWRIIERTGNCCENYLTTTPDGMLIDFGGNFLNYSRDRGQTWRQVQGPHPFLTGEGAVVVAPGGDIVAVGWDLTAADRMVAFKYEADIEQWHAMPIPLHEPFYDRQWITVVPDVTILGQTYEYVSYIKGGLQTKENWFFSTDGLNYLPMPGPSIQTADFLGDEVTVGPLPTAADPWLDWGQTNASTGLTPLGGGGLLARPSLLDGMFDVQSEDESWPYGLLDGKTNTWSSYALPEGGYVRNSGSRYQVDSAGRLHNVLPFEDGTGFTYRVSDDGGTTWQEVQVPLPPANSMDKDGCGACHGTMRVDFRANLAAGVAAVAILAHDASSGTEQTLVYKLDITDDAPRLVRHFRVGLGDISAGQVVTAGSAMHFGSLAIFPDGRVAVSFIDSTTDWVSPGMANDPWDPLHFIARNAPESGAAIAVEGDTEFGGPVERPQITLQSSRASVATSPQADNTAVLTATVVDARGNPVVGAPVVFSFANTPSGAPGAAGPLMPSLSPREATTDEQGLATATYTSGPHPGDDVIEAQTGSSRATITISVTGPGVNG